ncbi:MAG: 16S rRNA (cytosine(967)-C(5))-methyltransferase RsmB [Gammaproteobacteria bacterium]|nr:16S rRNA (cytosine(967)-C(5))-methyltransferase RsmB [Gammaproteobacteria bacterium]MDH5304354.1 16S rRNA (cytosine(967)-C(5))-methyltransferase RsmB [Gammaproteobacteria bacterium]MDH5323742.1 16S rRNA (cytosine(967)-C(5))-methyltransferase RsmB [Gammaproteobacteria bacterium]
MTDNKGGAELRATAALVVDAVVSAGRSLDRALAEHESRLPQRDRSLLRLLSYGTLRNYWCLQAWIKALLSRPLRPRDSSIGALLAVGLYQLSDTRIPDHAVVSETVAATRVLNKPKLAGLVNAVLRTFLREGGSSTMPLGVEARFAHPQWFIDAVRKDWPDDWQALLAANNDRAPMWLRTNPRHGTAADYVARLTAEGIESELLPAAPQAVRLLAPHDVEALPGFAAGHVSVQDAAAQLAAPFLLDGVAGRVLDACAAPGGKSGHLKEIGAGRIELSCVDVDQMRLAAVGASLERLGLDATLFCGDASNPESWWDGQLYDGILLDVPCSASGVIRRHPDIKHLRRPGDIASLASLQFAMLLALWPLLKAGGRLLYVTCSVLAAENDEIVRRFVSGRDDIKEINLLQNNNIRDLMRPKATGQQVLPGTAGLDGFYFACLGKVR